MSPAGRYRFGPFELDSRSGELRKGGLRVRLQEKPLQILQLLLARPGEVLTREELRARLWPDTFVDFDHGLNNAINRLREALSDSAERPRYIETLARRGYRLIAPVEALDGADAAAEDPSTPGSTPRPRAWALAAAVAAGATLLLPLAARWRREAPPPPAGAGRMMLAVLPFRDLDGDARREYFSDGLTEETIAQLRRLSPARLGVIARTSAMLYKHSEKRADQIGRELGAEWLVEGSVRGSGDRVRITATLVHAPDQADVWSRSYEGRLGDVLAFQSEVARAVANEIRLQLTPGEEARLERRAPIAPETYELYLKGRYQLNRRTEQGLREGLALFQQAVAAAPDYALAHAGVGDAYALLGAGAYTVVSPREAFPRAQAAARRALELDAGLAEAQATLGYVSYTYDWDWAEAERRFRLALAADPNYATGHHWFALYLKSMGRPEEALSEARQALELDPLSLIIGADVAWILYHARDFEGATRQCRKVLELDPSFPVAHWNLGLGYEQQGRYAEAAAEFRRALELAGPRPVYVAALARCQALAGHAAEARQALKQLSSSGSYVPAANVALVLLALGDVDQAFAMLERALLERSDFFVNLEVDPRLDPVRSDPRFAALLRRTGLGPP